jgi:hypothetical protein
MRLRYTLPALADLTSILDYIADRSEFSQNDQPGLASFATGSAELDAASWRHDEWVAPVFIGRGAPFSNCLGRASLQTGSARHDLLVQFLIDDLHRAVDLGAGRAKLMGNQLHQQVNPLDEGRSRGNRTGCR